MFRWFILRQSHTTRCNLVVLHYTYKNHRQNSSTSWNSHLQAVFAFFSNSWQHNGKKILNGNPEQSHLNRVAASIPESKTLQYAQIQVY